MECKHCKLTVEIEDKPVTTFLRIVSESVHTKYFALNKSKIYFLESYPILDNVKQSFLLQHLQL